MYEAMQENPTISSCGKCEKKEAYKSSIFNNLDRLHDIRVHCSKIVEVLHEKLMPICISDRLPSSCDKEDAKPYKPTSSLGLAISQECDVLEEELKRLSMLIASFDI